MILNLNRGYYGRVRPDRWTGGDSALPAQWSELQKPRASENREWAA